jgi:hypothetical protein
VTKKPLKIKIAREKLRPKERAPVMPTKKIEDRRRKDERRPKHKTDLRRRPEEE